MFKLFNDALNNLVMKGSAVTPVTIVSVIVHIVAACALFDEIPPMSAIGILVWSLIVGVLIGEYIDYRYS